jgi:hypothetical protein
LQGLWVHEGVFGPRHPRVVACPRCHSGPGVPCRRLGIKKTFEPLKRGRYHPARHEVARNR